MSIFTEICFAIAKPLVMAQQRNNHNTPAAQSRAAYQQWRDEELKTQFAETCDPLDVQGKDVLDFGCGGGELCFLSSGLDVNTITGIEISAEQVELAEQNAASRNLPVNPRFVLANEFDRINLPDNAYDVILCFDVLEHVMDYQSIMREWRRILRPGGKVFLWWMPWWHPYYGPHIYDMVPIPWCHLFFSEQVLIETCERIYDLPEYQPKIWEIDEQQQKKANPFTGMQHLPDLNKLTMAEFEGLCVEYGLDIEKRRLIGFGSSALARLSHGLLRIPLLKEFFTSRAIYAIQKSV